MTGEEGVPSGDCVHYDTRTKLFPLVSCTPPSQLRVLWRSHIHTHLLSGPPKCDLDPQRLSCQRLMTYHTSRKAQSKIWGRGGISVPPAAFGTINKNTHMVLRIPNYVYQPTVASSSDREMRHWADGFP